MTLTLQGFDYVRELVHRQAAIVLTPEKSYLVETRLAPIARQQGLESVEALVARLRSTPNGALHGAVVDAMTTNETSFFRDVHPFTLLERQLLPRLVERRGIGRRLHIWCAACSSGQEPYSVAMLIRDRFPSLATWDIRIVATDLSEEMLARAKEGRYSQLEVNRGLPAPMLLRYFRRDGASWQVNDHIRSMVEFRRMNLVQPWVGALNIDLLFMRNVLIYFDVPTKRSILERARRAMAPDGLLFLGTAETTLGIDDQFERIAHDRATYYRLRGRTP